MISRTCIRRFTTTTPKRGLFDFFKKTKVQEPVTPKIPVKKTKQVMEELTSSNQTEELKPVKLRVLGLPPDPMDEWEKVKNGFEVNPWPLRYNDPDITVEQINQALESAYEKVFKNTNSMNEITSTKLDDLQQRFEYFKAISKELNLSIPDRILTTSGSISDIQKYLNSQVAGIRFDEKNPEAIYLDNSDFEGLNITYIDKKAEIKRSKERFSKALQDAKEQQESKRKALLEESLN